MHPGAYSNAWNFLPFYFFSYMSYLGHLSLLRLQTRSEALDRATRLLSTRLSPITTRHLWAPWWTGLCMLFASTQKCAPCKEWCALVCWTDSMVQPPFNCSELLYNISLEPSYSIEWFPRYVASKKSGKFSATYCMVFLCVLSHVWLLHVLLKNVTQINILCVYPRLKVWTSWVVPVSTKYQ